MDKTDGWMTAKQSEMNDLSVQVSCQKYIQNTEKKSRSLNERENLELLLVL